MSEYAEDLPYWKTNQSDPGTWLERASTEIERAGGEVLGHGFGREGDRQAFILRFHLDDATFRVVWPVVDWDRSKHRYRGNYKRENFLKAAKRQAATMLFHDVKACCVKSRVLGAKVAFFAHMELQDGRVASELPGIQLVDLPSMLTIGEAPKALPAAGVEEVEAELVT